MYITAKSGEEVVKLLEAALDHYTKEKQDLLLKVDSNISKPKKLLGFPKKSNYPIGTHSLAYSCSSWFNHKGFWGGDKEISNSEELTKRKELIYSVVDKYIEDYTAVYQANIEIIEHNKAVANKITALMQGVGIPDKYSTSSYKSNRSRSPTTQTFKAGYLQDIDRNIPTYQPAIPSKQEMLRRVDETYRRIYDKIRLEETKAEREKQAQEELHKVALLRAKYTPDDASSSGWAIREAILAKDKYLCLAYWLERNRGDWNDGYSYAETGLDNFVVDPANPIDQEIYKDISACIASASDGYIDGRIFRDTEYNYSVLYGMVEDKTLLDDLQKVRDWMGGDDEL